MQSCICAEWFKPFYTIGSTWETAKLGSVLVQFSSLRRKPESITASVQRLHLATGLRRCGKDPFLDVKLVHYPKLASLHLSAIVSYNTAATDPIPEVQHDHPTDNPSGDF